MIRINETYYLSAYTLDDVERLSTVISDPEIARNTLTIPYPYSLDEAKKWLTELETRKQAGGAQCLWAIRNDKHQVCGAINRHQKYRPNSHKDEIGYWLMRPLWGQGLMTKVVNIFSQYCFDNFDLARLEAPVFDFNKGSARVLEKSGYQLEGVIRKAIRKDGVFYDSLLYAKIADQDE
ncbi:MAG: RimJ/RimL family protein N-acetyltransferase [Bacteroidia bacterium]